jgi:hypothetical protein
MNSIKNPVVDDTDDEILSEHSNKISKIYLRKYVNDFISSETGKKPVFGWIEKDLLSVHMSMMLIKHSRMNRIFNIKIDQLIESGIVQHLVTAEFANSSKVVEKQKEEEKQKIPEKLTMEHLELCFYAVLIGLALSCFVFVFELLIGFFSSR